MIPEILEQKFGPDGLLTLRRSRFIDPWLTYWQVVATATRNGHEVAAYDELVGFHGYTGWQRCIGGRLFDGRWPIWNRHHSKNHSHRYSYYLMLDGTIEMVRRTDQNLVH